MSFTTTTGEEIQGGQAIYCEGKLVIAVKRGDQWFCGGCKKELRLVDTDPPNAKRKAA